MIKVKCRTNRDDYKQETWPTELAEVPVIGRHRVQSKVGKRLMVVGLTWLFDGTLEVELNVDGVS